MFKRRKAKKKKELLDKVNHAYTYTFQDCEVSDTVELLREVLRELINEVYK
jgi:hypothetical protein